jgi:hypothetical protein
MTAVDLHLAAVDICTDEFVEHIRDSEALCSLGWKTISGITSVTVFTQADVVAEALAAARLLRDAGFTVLRVHEDRVSVAEITHRLRSNGVTPKAVEAWTAEASFPEPRTAAFHGTTVGVINVWDWADVVAWLTVYRVLSLDEPLPTELQVAQINAALLESRGDAQM